MNLWQVYIYIGITAYNAKVLCYFEKHEILINVSFSLFLMALWQRLIHLRFILRSILDRPKIDYREKLFANAA